MKRLKLFNKMMKRLKLLNTMMKRLKLLNIIIIIIIIQYLYSALYNNYSKSFTL
jgi:hypothetical protein